MIGFAAPLWLTALALVPIIRWLHRRSDAAPRIPVANLTLWNAAQPPGPDGARKSRTYDPAWIRRAAIASAIAIALSGPQFLHPGSSIIVWIDHSLSMQTRDGERSRLELALDRLDRDIAARRPDQVTLRSLATPALAWTSVDEARRWLLDTDHDPLEPEPLPGSALERLSEHWVVTDGADVSVNQWIAGAPISRVIRTGESADNVAVVGVGARPSPSAGRQIAVQVRVFNAGDRATRRAISLNAATGELARTSMQLPPGEVSTWQTEVGRVDGMLIVRVSPGDVLPLDDAIRLDTAPLRRTIALGPECRGPLRAAVNATPALETVDRGADIRVICGRKVVATEVPAIVVDVPRDTTSTREDARWVWSLRRPVPWLPGARTRAATPAVPAGPDDRVLLSIDDRVVIVRRGGSPARIDVGLDLQDPELARSEGYALLIAGIAESLVGANLIDPIASRERAVAPSRIRPLDVPDPAASGAARLAARVEDFTRFALVLGLALLAWDVIGQLARLRASRHNIAA